MLTSSLLTSSAPILTQCRTSPSYPDRPAISIYGLPRRRCSFSGTQHPAPQQVILYELIIMSSSELSINFDIRFSNSNTGVFHQCWLVTNEEVTLLLGTITIHVSALFCLYLPSLQRKGKFFSRLRLNI